MKINATILENSLISTGGFSYNPYLNRLNPDKGYMVSFKDGITVPLKGTNHKEIISTLLEDIKAQDVYLGAWVYKDNVYYDYSIKIDCINTAVKLGRANNQKAIYDCKNGQTLFLTKD